MNSKKRLLFVFFCITLIFFSCDTAMDLPDTPAPDPEEVADETEEGFNININLSGLSQKTGEVLLVSLFPEGTIIGNVDDQLAYCMEIIDESGDASAVLCDEPGVAFGVAAGTYTLMGLVDENEDFEGNVGELYLIPRDITVGNEDLSVTLVAADFDEIESNQTGGSVTVQLSGYPDYYLGKTVIAVLRDSGSPDVLNAATLTLDAAGNAEETIGDSVMVTFPPGEYDLQLLLDYNEDDDFTIDSGDAVAVMNITILGTQENDFPYTPADIPCLSTDPAKTGAVKISFPSVIADLLPIDAAHPWIVELYAIDEADPTITNTFPNMVAGSPEASYSITNSGTSSIHMIEPLPVTQQYLYYGYFDADGNGSLSTGDPSDNVWLLTIEEGVVLEETLYPYTIGRANHTFPSNDRNDIMNSYYINFSYTGSQLMVGEDSGGAYMCFILSETGTVSIGDDFSSSEYRFYDNSEWRDNTRVLLGEPAATSFYYIMLLDIDQSETVSTGDLWASSPLGTPQTLGDDPLDISIGDGDLTAITVE
ncbi:MAG: hypothetical protein JEZ04_09585 [Spirochaetales bacterium]|nr:hypothetical protein [Spirochaetales bacterium]